MRSCSHFDSIRSLPTGFERSVSSIMAVMGRVVVRATSGPNSRSGVDSEELTPSSNPLKDKRSTRKNVRQKRARVSVVPVHLVATVQSLRPHTDMIVAPALCLLKAKNQLKRYCHLIWIFSSRTILSRVLRD